MLIFRQRHRKTECKFINLALSLLLLSNIFVCVRGKGLCIPNEERRAYVTILSDKSNFVGVRVLLQSLRESNSKGHFIVLVSGEISKLSSISRLVEDGVVVKLVENPLKSGEKWQSKYLQETANFISLLSLTDYDRIVYLSPKTLVTKNADSLFACEGFCASTYDSVSVNPKYINDVMVLEPNLDRFASANKFLLNLNSKIQSQLKSSSLISMVFAPVSECPMFENLEDFLGNETADQDGPILMLNAEHMPECSSGQSKSDSKICHQLPDTYTASSSEFNRIGKWVDMQDKLGRDTDLPQEPHIVRFEDSDMPWGGTVFLQRELFWRWNGFHDRLSNPYGNLLNPLMLMIIPVVLLASLFMHRYMCKRKMDSNKNHPSASQRTAENEPISPRFDFSLPFCGNSYTGKGSEDKYTCNSLLPLALLYSIGWYTLSMRWSKGFADPIWHPVAFTLVYHAWLACALAIGLSIIDYINYTIETKGKTLARDFIFTTAYFALILIIWHVFSPILMIKDATKILFVAATCFWVILQSRMNTPNPQHFLKSQKHLGVLVTCCALAGFISASLAIYSSINSSYSHLFGFVRGALTFSVLAVYIRPYVQSFAQSISKKMLHMSSQITYLFVPMQHSKKMGRSTVSVVRQWALHLVLRQWDWLITIGVFVWLVVVLSGELRKQSNLSIMRKKFATKRYQVYGEQCLVSDRGYASNGPATANFCGANETFKPIIMFNGAVCLRTVEGKFLTPKRGKLSDICGPETQFVFQLANEENRKKKRASTIEVNRDIEKPNQRDKLRLCIYNEKTGLYLSSTSHPQPLCRRTELWQIVSWSW